MKAAAPREIETAGAGARRKCNQGFALRAPGYRMQLAVARRPPIDGSDPLPFALPAIGRDFSAGKYAPGGSDSSQLLAHEFVPGVQAQRTEAPSLPAPSLPTKPARVRDTTTAVEVARGPGAPLPLDVQRDAALRFGHSFSHVRIHADASASAVAKTLHAAAFTLGGHIVFDANRYAPESLQGQLLLQHELRHVSEQRSAAAVAEPDLDAPHPMHERDAHSLDSQVEPVSVQRIQCAPEDAEFSLGGGVVDSVGKSAFGDSAWPFIKAVFEGFVGGLRADVKSGRADQAKGHLSKLFIPWNAVKFYGGYLLGLVLGLISPITDLVKGIIGVVKLGISALEWLAKWSPVGVAISPERQQKVATLMQKFADLSTEFGKALSDFVSDPKGTVKKFAGFLDNLMQLALGKARELGTKAAHSMFDFLEKEFFDMGQGIGEVIGALIAQILLLVFSDAIGNLISKGASFLGKAAEFVAGKAVELFEWVKGFASEVVTLLHDAVKGALKLFEGLVNKAIEAFDAFKAIFTEEAELNAEIERSFAATFTEHPPAQHVPPGSGIVAQPPEVAAGFAASELPAFRRLLGKPLTDPAVSKLGEIWTGVANPGEEATLTLENSRGLFDNQRGRFWRAVRKDTAARRLFEDAGCVFEGGDTTAPFQRLPDGSKFQMTIDHIVERQSAPTRALAPSNLRVVSRRENVVVLRQLHEQSPFAQ